MKSDIYLIIIIFISSFFELTRQNNLIFSVLILNLRVFDRNNLVFGFFFVVQCNLVISFIPKTRNLCVNFPCLQFLQRNLQPYHTMYPKLQFEDNMKCIQTKIHYWASILKCNIHCALYFCNFLAYKTQGFNFYFISSHS